MKNIIIISIAICLFVACKSAEYQYKKHRERSFSIHATLQLRENHTYKTQSAFRTNNRTRFGVHRGKWELHGDTLVLDGATTYDIFAPRMFIVNEDFSKIYHLDGREAYSKAIIPRYFSIYKRVLNTECVE